MGHLGGDSIVRQTERHRALGCSGPDLGLEASEMEPSSFLSSLGSKGPVEQEKRRAEPSSLQTRVRFHTSAPGPCPRPIIQPHLSPGNHDSAWPPISHLSPAWTKRDAAGHPAVSQAASCGGSTQGRGLATFPASASMSFTHSWARRAFATTCISGVFLPPLSISPKARIGPATQGPGS